MSEQRTFFLLLLLVLLSGCALSSAKPQPRQQSLIPFDSARSREIPVEIYFPLREKEASTPCPCPTAFISGGYGGSHTAYSFIAHQLNDMGYLVVSVQHELPTDEPMAVEGNLYALRMPVWQRGEENLRFVRTDLAAKYPEFDWTRSVLIGHSNGGDISTLFASDDPSSVSALITLDHRRMPLPRTSAFRTLTIRASDFEADPGVLPSPEEEGKFDIRVIKLAGAKHNDMYDGGSTDLKRSIAESIERFLTTDEGKGR